MGDLAFAQGPLAHSSAEQVKGGTEYQAGSTDDYVKKYGGDVRSWPYKATKPFDPREAINPNPGGMK